MKVEIELLTRILAAQDAVWIPHRDWTLARSSNIWHARTVFAEHGVSWRSGGLTEAETRNRSRVIERLKKDGRLTAWQPKAKSLRVKLSDEAEAEARARCNLPGMRSAFLAMCDIAQNSDREPETLDRLWVPETTLNEGNGWGDGLHWQLVRVEEALLPVMARGLVVSLADKQRHVYYALTPAGWRALDAGDVPTEPAADPDDRPRRLYYRQLQQALAAWDHPALDQREIGGIPLPVSHHGLPIGPWTADPVPVAALALDTEE